MVAVELSRLLRRALLVAAVAAAGWLLSAALAGTASADELPDDGTRNGTQNQKLQSGNGLLGGLIGGLSNVLTGATDTVTDVTGTLLRPPADLLPPIADEPPAPEEPVVDLPSTLPAGSSSGGAATDRADASDVAVSRTDTAVPAPVATPAVPVVPPPAPVVAAPVRQEPAAPPVVAAPAAPVAAEDSGSGAAEQAGEGGSQPQPVKAPATPAGSGTTVSSTHDNPGSARGTHGVLPTQATLHPADAGFTTRSRAGDAAGRATGLPASSPD